MPYFTKFDFKKNIYSCKIISANICKAYSTNTEILTFEINDMKFRNLDPTDHVTHKY